MSHDPHDHLKGIVLFDGCFECESRAGKGLDGLFELDESSLRILATYSGPGQRESSVLSYADRKAIDTLRAAGRVVFRSELREADAR